MRIFDTAARQQIEAKIAEIETQGHGEFVVVTANRSDTYMGWRLLFAALMAWVLTVIFAYEWPELGEWLLLIQAALFVLFWLLSAWSPLLRRIAPDHVEIACVHRRAELMFLERGMFETIHRTGVLIFVSELEHRVEILADKGIHARVQTKGWDRHVETIIAAIRAQKPAEGVCAVLDALAHEVQAVFPADSAKNELPDAVHSADI